MRITLQSAAALTLLSLATAAPARSEEVPTSHVTPPLYRDQARATAATKMHADLRTVPQPVRTGVDAPVVALVEGAALASAR